jgi:hypothetical protein
MASAPGKLTVAVILALLAVTVAHGAEPAKPLLECTFAGAEVGSQPGPWIYFVDDGNAVAVADAPVIGGHCLKLSRSGGTVWKPMISGGVAGHPEDTICLEFDWYLPALSDSVDSVLYVTLRGEGNINLVSAALGGPGGASVPQGKDDWLPLGFRIKAGEWGHAGVTADPLARKGEGAFDLVVSQGQERICYPNIAFRPNGRGEFPNALWYSPTFHVGGGAPGRPREAYITNIRMTVVPPREDR